MRDFDVEEFGSEGGRATSAETSAVVSVLCSSFFDYPAMRYILGSGSGYAEQLRRLAGFFVAARMLRCEPIFYVRSPKDHAPAQLAGVALVSRPSSGSPPELDELREHTWSEIGHEARARYERFGRVAGQFVTPPKHIRLNMIGVAEAWRGNGVGRALLDRVHQVSAADPASAGVSLTTEVSSNVGLYEHIGYEVMGVESVGEELTTWGMFRPDPT